MYNLLTTLPAVSILTCYQQLDNSPLVLQLLESSKQYIIPLSIGIISQTTETERTSFTSRSRAIGKKVSINGV